MKTLLQVIMAEFSLIFFSSDHFGGKNTVRIFFFFFELCTTTEQCQLRPGRESLNCFVCVNEGNRMIPRCPIPQLATPITSSLLQVNSTTQSTHLHVSQPSDTPVTCQSTSQPANTSACQPAKQHIYQLAHQLTHLRANQLPTHLQTSQPAMQTRDMLLSPLASLRNSYMSIPKRVHSTNSLVNYNDRHFAARHHRPATRCQKRGVKGTICDTDLFLPCHKQRKNINREKDEKIACISEVFQFQHVFIFFNYVYFSFVLRKIKYH